MSKDPHPYLELLVVLAVVTSPYWLIATAGIILLAPPPVRMVAGTVTGALLILGIVRVVNRRRKANAPSDSE